MQNTDSSMFNARIQRVSRRWDEDLIFSIAELNRSPTQYKLPSDFIIPNKNQKHNDYTEEKHLFNLYRGSARLIRKLDSDSKKLFQPVIDRQTMLTFYGSTLYLEGDYLITEISSDKVPRDTWVRNSQKILSYPSSNIDLTFEFDVGCTYACLDPSPTYEVYPELTLRSSSFLYFSSKAQKVEIKRSGILYSTETQAIEQVYEGDTKNLIADEMVLLIVVREI